MAYSSSGGQPTEFANHVGHISIIQDDNVRRIVQDFAKCMTNRNEIEKSTWNRIKFASTKVNRVIVSDGSYIHVKEQGNDIAFFSVGTIELPVTTLEKIFHPYDYKRIMRDGFECVHTVLPIKLINSTNKLSKKELRNAIISTFQENPVLASTLKWILLEEWNPDQKNVAIRCKKCKSIFRFGENSLQCECEVKQYIADLLDWPYMSSRESHFSGSFMLVLETLMLFSKIKSVWENDPEQLNSILFMHDGPLFLGADYHKIVAGINAFFRYTAEINRHIMLVGIEKSGYFYDYLESLDRIKSDDILFMILTRKYIKENINPCVSNEYGDGVLYGQKAFLMFPDNTRLVITVPRCDGEKEDKVQLMEFEQIVTELPQLVTHMYKNALYPITVINHRVSIARESGEKILRCYVKKLLEEAQ